MQQPLSRGRGLIYQPFAKALHLGPQQALRAETSLKSVTGPLSTRYREWQAQGAVLDAGTQEGQPAESQARVRAYGLQGGLDALEANAAVGLRSIEPLSVDPGGPVGCARILLVEVQMQQRKSLQPVMQRNAGYAARVLRGADRQHEVSEQEVSVWIAALRSEVELAVDLTDSQRRVTLTVDAEKNVRMLSPEAAQTRLQPEIRNV